jgi:ABC-type transport system involved in cytochrome c biogenesis permease subunit
MIKALPWIVFLAASLWIITSALRDSSQSDTLDFEAFRKIPVLLNGRTKPLDTVARNSLLVLRDKQTLRGLENVKISSIEWLAEVLFDGPAADQRKIIVIHDPEVLSLFDWKQDRGKYFSFKEFFPHFAEIDRQSRMADEVESQQRTRFQKHILQLFRQLTVFQRLKNTVQPEDTPGFSDELQVFNKSVKPGLEAIERRDKGLEFDPASFNAMIAFGNRYQRLAADGHFFIVPPGSEDPDQNAWRKSGDVILETIGSGTISPVLSAYARLSDAYRAKDSTAFDRAARELTDHLGTTHAGPVRKAAQETFFNHLSPFYKSMVLYVLVLLLACASWLTSPTLLGRTAFYLGVLALIIHTGGLVYRMYLEGRPPVTNLYSSAVFVGWAAAVLGLILERLFRNGIGSVTTASIGFSTLLVAHHLSGDGDTMEMMRAVLDSNFWLATHVVVITIGYSSTFLAGFLAIVYIIRGVVTRTLDKATANSLNRMVYGIVCFALLFSFVGTVLGGIWADQSWGRFWGWDPKENGAALIVLWNAVIIHSRWGGFIRRRGFMVMAVFGNIVTSWSWFGTNMLGIGLHSYGFMDKAFIWLLIFIISQLILMGMGGLPPRFWRSQITAPGRGT